MKEELKTLLESKAKLFEDQKKFSGVLFQRYPSLISEDLETHIKNLDDELEFLLSSSLKSKSGRIKISAPDLGWKKVVVLTRNPGLKFPYESYQAFKLSRVSKFGDNGDIVKVRNSYNEKKGLVKLSILKESGQIDQEKLEAFYEFLKELIQWKEEEKAFIPDSSSDDDKTGIKIGEHKLNFYNKGFRLYMLREKSKRGYYHWAEIWNPEIKRYRVDEWEDYEENEEPGENSDLPEIENQKPLLNFLVAFEDFDKILLEHEKLKIELVAKAKDLYQRLKEYNRPFKVLNKLINS